MDTFARFFGPHGAPRKSPLRRGPQTPKSWGPGARKAVRSDPSAQVDPRDAPTAPGYWHRSLVIGSHRFAQAMLMLNSMTPIGKNWWRRGLMLNFKLVKNVPRDFFSPRDELDLASVFPRGYFEWEEDDGAPVQIEGGQLVFPAD